jgi:hypothetical protein
MSEAEFDLLLEAVSAAVATAPEEDLLIRSNQPLMAAGRPLKPANDNQLAWPLVPFPAGWHASC